MSSQLAIFISIVLLLGNAFFVASEFAIMSTRRAKLEPLVEEGKWGAKPALWAVEHVSVMLATAQLGVTLCSTGLGAVAEPAIAHWIATPLHSLGLPEASAHVVAIVIALLMVVYLHVVFGEMVPKNLSVAMPEKAILVLAPLLVACERLFGPLVRALDRFANRIVRLFGVEPKSEVGAVFTLEEVAQIVEVSRAEGVLEDEVGLLAGALEFSSETAAKIMVPLEQLVTVPEDVTPAEVERVVAKTGFSRFLVVDETDTMVGYLHLKDVLYAEHSEDQDLREKPVDAWRIRSLARVAADSEVDEALAHMQQTATHLAMVMENQKAVGVLFLEDIIEELVGEVRDCMQKADRL
ncbi:hypothetical protein BK816_03570 [Boudabousia tangfeifanii]|uniref:HlyC/CorC family transporter n=1 Tax=Boudabousia tangfeifanii TaxID=1912795 RepID=A0A1D9MJM5_9ACTO|nr:hemolysin family protein [Boudabousia tangfeifanii]AOZ72486.1 hypothetical protein BK816_03570 [Boudabousia tangfeifanii]